MKVEATDSGGNTTSDVITFTSKANMPPSVSIAWPREGIDLTAGDRVTVKASATDDGSVVAVELFTELPGCVQSLGILTAPPYERTMTVPLDCAGSSIRLYAEATDDMGG
jgi:chitodextrinase